jgi:hypothetical protein
MPRAVLAAVILAAVASILAAFIGYRAIKISTIAIDTLETYNEVMREMLIMRSKSLEPRKF